MLSSLSIEYCVIGFQMLEFNSRNGRITGQRDSAWPCVNGDYEFSAKWQNFYTLPNLELSTDLLQFCCG